MKTLIRALVALVILAAGFLLGAGFERSRTLSAPAPVSSREMQSASVLIDTGSELLGFQDVVAVGEATALSLLEEAAGRNTDVTVATESYGDIGTLVTAINGYQNGHDGNYWQFWVNNEYAEVAADKYPVATGDSVMWKFTSARFNEY